MLSEIKKEVCRANRALESSGLVRLTWGNVSGMDRASGLWCIKPSGVPYAELQPDDMVVLDLDGKIVEGTLRPSSDTKTHLHLYREGFGDKWAVPLPADRFQNPADVWATFEDFLRFCNITQPPHIDRRLIT